MLIPLLTSQANMNNSHGENEMTLSYTTKSFIKRVVHELLAKCSDIPFDKVPFDQDLYDESEETLVSEFHFSSSPWFGRYISTGVDLVSTSYSHLSRRNQVHVVIYAAFTIALDDIFEKNYGHMEGFNERFVKGLPQDNPMLDGLAKSLFDMPEYYDRIQNNLIVTSTLDFVTSMMMDMKIRKTTVDNEPGFAHRFGRILAEHVWCSSGLCDVHIPEDHRCCRVYSISTSDKHVHQWHE